MWGNATAQIFGSVSGRMHWEFALKHEMRWLERWGLTYYGCCEPLDIKMGILRRIPNLRKISMSPWVDVERAVRGGRRRLCLLAQAHPGGAGRGRLAAGAGACTTWRDFLEQARGCRIEIIMKDISTVRYQPQRLWEWEQIAMALAQEYAP